MLLWSTLTISVDAKEEICFHMWTWWWFISNHIMVVSDFFIKFYSTCKRSNYDGFGMEGCDVVAGNVGKVTAYRFNVLQRLATRTGGVHES